MNGRVGRPDKNTAAQNRANVLDALGRGLTYTQASEAAGVAPSTVSRYMKDDTFRAHVNAQHLDAIDELNRILAARALRALDVLTREMGTSPSGTTRIRAALGILNAARASRDATLERQIAQLEEQVGPQPTPLRIA